MNLIDLKESVSSMLLRVPSIDHPSAFSEIENILSPLISYYEDIIGCMPGNVFWIDTYGIGAGCNQNVLDLFGLKSVQEFRGLTFEAMGELGRWSREATESFKEDTFEVIRTGKPKLNIEEPPIPQQDGRMVYFLSSRVPLFDRQKNVIGVVGISTDISDLKKAQIDLEESRQRAEVANKAKSEFLANMSHELRTPLNGILGMAQVLHYSSALSRDDADKVSDIITSGKILLDLINDVLNFAKLESCKVELRNVEFNFPKILGEVTTTVLPLSTQKNLIFESRYSQACPEIIVGDPLRIRQIIMNIVGNAIKFTDHGRVSVSVELLSQEGDTVVLQVTVEDTGCGIPEDQLETIFERFHQVNPAYVRTHTGTGLGLTIVKKLVEEIGGKISVNSRLGVGATFYFTLPCQAGVTA